MTKSDNSPYSHNWPQLAEDFLNQYDKDYLTKEHIKDIAVDFRLEYKLNEEPAFAYIDKAVRKHLGWLPCIVCGKASVMQTGETPRRYYCSEHIPDYTISQRKDPESPSPISLEGINSFVEKWLLLNKNDFNFAKKRLILSEELTNRFDLGLEEAYSLADQSIIEPENLASPGKARTSEVVGKKPIDENLASTTKESTYTPVGKKPILTLNFRHDYFKLKNDEFTTMRGKSLYYKNFKVNGQPHKLQRDDIIRITKQKEFYCLCELTNISLKRICDCPLEFLKNDAECDSITINSKQDFVKGINSLRAPHWTQATIDSNMTVLYLKKLSPADPRVDESLASPGNEKIPESIGKNDIQEEPRQESLASHPIVSDPEGKNIGKIMKLANIDEHLALKFNPESGEPTYKVVKKGTEFYISANIQGLVKKTKKCNKKGCRCLNGKEHGPYYYLYIKDPNTGTRRELYFGRAAA